MDNPTLYALLVGIDAYPPPLRALQGCVNDVEAMRTLLQERGTRAGARIEAAMLLNEKATRRAVIDTLRTHLGRAGRGDVALFLYCGHGSQQPTAPEFWHLEPDRLDETLVCYDSRNPGQHDLADKELSKLIAEVAGGGAHLVVILDSCHSGSGTRVGDSPGVRLAPSDARVRDVASYLATPADWSAASRGNQARGASGGWLALPAGRHVVISACQSDQQAQELRFDGRPRGVFSYFLQQALQGTKGTPTYRDLFKRVDALVRTRVSHQSPVIEATDLSDLDRPFAGGPLAQRAAYFTLTLDRAGDWVMDGGSTHGILPPSGDETTWLAVFPVNAASFEENQAIGTAQVLKTLPGHSVVEASLSSGGALDRALAYKAIVIAQPLAPIDVQIDGDVTVGDSLRRALARAEMGERPSLWVRESSDLPQLRVAVNPEGFRITRIADDEPLGIGIAGTDPDASQSAVRCLEHIARWIQIGGLGNPTSQLPDDAIRLEVLAEGEQGELVPLSVAAGGTGLELAYRIRDGHWHAPTFRVRLRNISTRRLYCMLLDLTQTYRVWPGMLPGGGVWLAPQQEAWALQGQTIRAEVPDSLWLQGMTKIVDTLKLLVATEYSDATLLELPELDARVRSRDLGRDKRSPANALERLMQRVQTRDLSAQPSAKEQLVDWTASELTITTWRPPAVPDAARMLSP